MTCSLAVALVGGAFFAAAEGRMNSKPAQRMAEVGHAFVFDYGALKIRASYLSGDRLAWEQLEGPQRGLKGEESYGFAVVRPRVYLIWWQERDSSVVAQTADFEKQIVHTVWVSPDQKVSHFQGAIRKVE